VVTFDLDDTLWPTTGVVLAANSDLSNWLKENYPTMKHESSAVQATIKAIRKEKEETIPDYRVYYSELRESAIVRLALEGGYDAPTAQAVGTDGFRVWLQARHDNADRLVFHDAVTTLKALKGRGYLVGAITNGAGDPRQVKSLAPFFDFYVSSEERAVRRPKPSSDPFEAALQRVAESIKIDAKELIKGWVHVGDCLTNDIAAAKEMNMRTVHYAPPEDNESPTWKQLRKTDAGLSSAPLDTSEETEEDLSAADAQISELSELVALLENWDEYCCAAAL